ncbi:hypothetical protein [Microbacterium sp. 18062]|uniref:hypothetical protein n=1 Tax=Microbacterium sp. 18062 TaxID=2681410 RepID=UPI0013574CF7|nr:hypothetical protein [Microbacterium sp. 18062]
MSDAQNPTAGDDAGTEPADIDEVALQEEGALDGTPPVADPREEAELRAQIERELRFDGFEQGIQG